MKSHILLIVCAFFLLSWKTNEVSCDYLIEHVNIVDVENGIIHFDKHVSIEGYRISGVYDVQVIPTDSAIVIDGSEKFLIPGLWDMHSHYYSDYKLYNKLLIANGVTGIREMWGNIDTINHIRDLSSSGNLLAPDIYTAGNIIGGNDVWMRGIFRTEDPGEADAEVRLQVEKGVDYIKIYGGLSKEVYMAIAQASKELDVPFAGHLTHAVSIWEAIEANQQSLEHFMNILPACSNDQETYRTLIDNESEEAEIYDFLMKTFCKTTFDSLASTLSKSNTWLCPTFIYWKNFYNRDNVDLMNDPRLEYMPSSYKLWWETPEEVLSKRKDDFRSGRAKLEFELPLIGELNRAGVKILAGTDYPNPFCYPGFSLHDELELMVQGGMTPAEALKTATYNPAVFMGKEDEFGTIESGRTASLVLLDANPLEDIVNLKKINSLMLRGIFMNRSSLDSLLQSAIDMNRMEQ
jgi:imidazolonepropionase-like amidohydrolase